MDAMLYLHERTRRIVIHDISRGGMRLEHAFGLMPDDVVTIELLSHPTFAGTVVWVAAPFTGIAFDELLSEDDPVLFGATKPSEL